MNIGDRVVVTVKESLYEGAIGTITEIRDSKEHPLGIRRDGFRSDTGFNFDEVKPFVPKYDWQYGDNGVQEYYDVTVNGKYLLVFRNKADKNLKHWMCSIDNVMIENKTRNNYYRNKEGSTNPFSHHCMLFGYPAYLIKKVEYCFDHNMTEITA